MFQDVRYAFRQLRKNLGFATVAVLTLALGIGAAAAMFGLIQGVLLSPPPYADPERLVLVMPSRVDGAPYTNGSTVGQVSAWRAGVRAIESPAMYRWTFNFLVRPDGSESLGGMVVTREFFSVLGLKPLLGRTFTEAELGRRDGSKGSPPSAIILGYELWQRKFNGDPAIIGKTVRISRMPAPLPVVGVMPRGVRFLPDPSNASEPNYDVNAPVDFWFGVALDQAQPKAGGWNVVGRLRDDATLAQTRAEVATIAASYAQTDRDLAGVTAGVETVPAVLNEEGRRLLVPLFGSVALVFFIACGNVAGLLLARGLQRQPEYAMRSALGAGQWRLFRQVLTESVALALVGATLGAFLAVALVRLLKAIGGHAVPRLDAVSVGWPVFLFGLLAALLAAVVAGLLPAIRASAPDRGPGLEGVRTSASRAERRLLGAVATLQIVLTVALLAGAALMVRTARNLSNVRPGYDTEHVLAMTVTSVRPDDWKRFHTEALQRVSALPGVRHAAFVWGLPLTGNKWMGNMSIVGRSSEAGTSSGTAGSAGSSGTAATPGPAAGSAGSDAASRVTDQITVPLRSVTSAYFDAMSMPIVDGRGFRETDDDKAPRVVVVNQTLARRYFAGANPLGRKVFFGGDAAHPVEIIGIVADTRTEALSERAEPELYFSFWQQGPFSKHMILRVNGDPLAAAAAVRRELHQVDPTAAVEHMKTMAEIRSESVAPRTFAMHLLTGFSLVATLLALVGLYGVLSLSVGSRLKEIAVRKAIGAQGSEILRLVLGEGFRLIAVGVAIGTAVALVLGPVLGTLLFEVRPTDPLTLAMSATLFGLVALLACVRPAWRAARVDLMEALRHE